MGVYGQTSQPSRTVSSNTTLLPDDHTILVDTTSGDVTITVPDAATLANKEYRVKKKSTDGNVLWIIPNSPSLIDGKTSKSTTATVRPSFLLKSDGTNWNLH